MYARCRQSTGWIITFLVLNSLVPTELQSFFFFNIRHAEPYKSKIICPIFDSTYSKQIHIRSCASTNYMQQLVSSGTNTLRINKIIIIQRQQAWWQSGSGAQKQPKKLLESCFITSLLHHPAANGYLDPLGQGSQMWHSYITLLHIIGYGNCAERSSEQTDFFHLRDVNNIMECWHYTSTI